MESTLDWYGCATFRLRTGDVTVFLDAYIDRAPGAAGTGLRADDVEACDWIVVGHSHFDHLWGAERILANTNARLIGNYETVRLLEIQGVPLERMIAVGGGERIQLGDEVFVTVYPSLHSCTWTGTHRAGSGDACFGDLGVTWQEREARIKELTGRLGSLGPPAIEHLILAAAGHSDRGDGATLLFYFETPQGTLLFQDTSGRWASVLDGLSPDVAILGAAGRGNCDGEPVQGSLADFVADEVRRLGPRRVFLCHHDDWLPGFAGVPDVGPIRAEINRTSPTVDLVETGYLASTPLFANLPRS